MISEKCLTWFVKSHKSPSAILWNQVFDIHCTITQYFYNKFTIQSTVILFYKCSLFQKFPWIIQSLTSAVSSKIWANILSVESFIRWFNSVTKICSNPLIYSTNLLKSSFQYVSWYICGIYSNFSVLFNCYYYIVEESDSGSTLDLQ
jgi:hypothetical protein